TTRNPQDNPTLYMFRDQDLLNYSFYAPDWEFPSIDGVNRTISQYEGKWLLLDFFATWCYYCKLQNPAMVQLHDEYSTDELQILHVTTSLGDSLVMLEDYADEHDITWPIVYGTDKIAADYFRIIGIPTTVVIDPDGIIR
ncbi:MAG: TlpA disulfide reductase family protein, partial [Candidatus Thorarchaeota archaeon]|nr:TlpA disulfide reductase family protein [Candidatus Thorarchaeota archaeon]